MEGCCVALCCVVLCCVVLCCVVLCCVVLCCVVLCLEARQNLLESSFVISMMFRMPPGAHPDGFNMTAGNQQKHLSLSFATKA